mmetsp:Transcript_31492/g.57184  ORF Transcript_31492/g.57184 Transcript_31492/m.57184 type:complete len:133 (+) Transcript_31492:699-1097(+)
MILERAAMKLDPASGFSRLGSRFKEATDFSADLDLEDETALESERGGEGEEDLEELELEERELEKGGEGVKEKDLSLILSFPLAFELLFGTLLLFALASFDFVFTPPCPSLSPFSPLLCSPFSPSASKSKLT